MPSFSNETSGSQSSPASLAREYLEDGGSLRTLATAVETADREAVLRMNRRALANSYSRENAVLNRAASVSDDADMSEEDTEFNVDSPRTINNYTQSNSWVPIIAGALLGAMGMGVPIMMSALTTNSPPEPPPSAGKDADTDTQYRVEIE